MKSMVKGPPQVGRLLVGGIAVTLAGFLLSVSGAIDHLSSLADFIETPRPSASQPTEIPSVDEEQFVMIYFGNSRCGWCARPQTNELLRRAATSLRETAEDNAAGFVTIGVALDDRLETGLDHLRLLGIFDQVLAGYGYANVGSIDMFRGVLPRINGTPTVAVIHRRLGVVGNAVYSSDAQLVAFKRGMQQIAPWVHAGAPVRSVKRRSSRDPDPDEHDADLLQERRPSTHSSRDDQLILFQTTRGMI